MSTLEEYRERIIQRERADMLATIAALEAELQTAEAEVSALKAQLREGRSHTRHTYPDFSHQCVGLINDVVPPDRVSDE